MERLSVIELLNVALVLRAKCCQSEDKSTIKHQTALIIVAGHACYGLQRRYAVVSLTCSG